MHTQSQTLNLIGRITAGDPEAFEELIDSRKNLIAFKIRRLTFCPEDIEDISQEVAIRVFQRIGSLKSPEAFDSWLHKIIIRECYRYFAAQNQRAYLEESSTPEILFVETDVDYLPMANTVRLESLTEIGTALGRMSEPVQKMVALHFGDKMRYREIAEYMDVPIGTVSSNIYRTIQKLRKELVCLETV